MKTASWYTWRGPGRIGISIGTPRGQPGGFRLYRPLSPTRDMLKLERPEYEAIYLGMLSKLDPQRVWDDLHEMAAGAEPHLLCFERPPFAEGNWCHRRMCATWLENELGVEIPELDFEGRDPG